MANHGFLRVAAAVPHLRVADCDFNAERIVGLMGHAQRAGVSVLLFPELCLTGYTCADLFQHSTLHEGALAALDRVVRASSETYSGITVVGLPLLVQDRLFDCAAVVHGGAVLGVVPKSYLPNYKEFYEQRWFTPAATLEIDSVPVLGRSVPFGPRQLFRAADVPGLIVGVEICEDLWVPIPPSSHQALAGATVLLNPSASNDLIGKAAYRRQLVTNQSGRCIAAYVYASCGTAESTTDVIFGGHAMIAENGVLLAESDRFTTGETLLVADVDLQRLQWDRARMVSYADQSVSRQQACEFNVTELNLDPPPLPTPLRRPIDPHPFVPRGKEQLRERCEEIFHLQVSGLAKRLEHVDCSEVAIGVSGGLDSTLALLVTCKTMDRLGLDRKRIRAFTLPGFGTTDRTLHNARGLIGTLGATLREIDIRPLCLAEMRALGHHPFGIDVNGLSVEEFTARLRQLPAGQRNDVVFENVQARMRTNLLMNAGFVVGTSDLSELALGWTTYNGDHMSMYNPNVSVPKTLVRFLVDWAARNEFTGAARQLLLDIVATTISPELLPAGGDGAIVQATEEVIGPYELHDFFLFHFLRYGSSPEKILFLAEQVQFEGSYSAAEIRRWLRVFIKRFFRNQFKRSCLPDGPKVGSVSLSPRGDWRMPSDAEAALWLRWAEDPAVEAPPSREPARQQVAP